jgi:hypothetical protein
MKIHMFKNWVRTLCGLKVPTWGGSGDTVLNAERKDGMTTDDKRVTCPKCKELLGEQNKRT